MYNDPRLYTTIYGRRRTIENTVINFYAARRGCLRTCFLFLNILLTHNPNLNIYRLVDHCILRNSQKVTIDQNIHSVP